MLAPKRVAQLVWPDEIKLWSAHPAHEACPAERVPPKQRSADIITAPKRELTIVGIDNTQWLCGELERLPDDHPLFDVLIIDEISRFRNPKSKRAKALLTQVKRFKNIWGLTGTPRPNGLEDLFKPLQIISRDKIWGRSFYTWRDTRFYPTDYERRNWAIKPDWEERTNVEAAAYTSTMSPEDMPDLPALNIIEHFVDLPEDAQETYDDMESKVVRSAPGPGRARGIRRRRIRQAIASRAGVHVRQRWGPPGHDAAHRQARMGSGISRREHGRIRR